MSYILNKQRERNSSTANHWGLYAGHRRRVATLLQEARTSGGGRLCLLGAGNCNDLDLNLLTQQYDELHLVDWDADSMTSGLERQQVSPEAVSLYDGIEFTGVARYIERWKQSAPSNAEINEVIALLARPYDIGLGSLFDVVLSGSLLTQLIEPTIVFLGREHPRVMEVVVNIRAAHFRLITSLLAPGGTGILVTELISSDTCEELNGCPEDRLSELHYTLIREKRFFMGTNPQAMIPSLFADPLIASQIEQPKITAPWKWQIGPGRSFLAYGCVFKKKH